MSLPYENNSAPSKCAQRAYYAANIDTFPGHSSVYAAPVITYHTYGKSLRFIMSSEGETRVEIREAIESTKDDSRIIEPTSQTLKSRPIGGEMELVTHAKGHVLLTSAKYSKET